MFIPNSKLDTMELLYPKRRPVGKVKIDWSKPLARGLHDVYLFGISGIRSLVYNTKIDVVGSAILKHDRITTNASGQYIDVGILPISAWGGASFHLVYSNITGRSGAGNGRILGVLHSGSDDLRVYISDANVDAGSLLVAWDDGTPTTSSVTAPASGDVSLTITHDGATQNSFVNGVLNSSDANACTFSGFSGETLVGTSPVASSGISADYHLLIVHNRKLTAQEAKSLHDNPYQFLIPA